MEWITLHFQQLWLGIMTHPVAKSSSLPNSPVVGGWDVGEVLKLDG